MIITCIRMQTKLRKRSQGQKIVSFYIYIKSTRVYLNSARHCTSIKFLIMVQHNFYFVILFNCNNYFIVILFYRFPFLDKKCYLFSFHINDLINLNLLIVIFDSVNNFVGFLSLIFSLINWYHNTIVKTY